MKRLPAGAIVLLFSLLLPNHMFGQWRLEASGVTESLRGISSVNDQVAWASGTAGTVLRTVDGGQSWHRCTVPAGSEKLDFRAIQAWSEVSAVVMSSGTGDLSRLYRTSDGCKSWSLLVTNTDKTGFWDAIQFPTPQIGTLLGDPVDGHFVIMTTVDGGAHWTRQRNDKEPAITGQGIFAASNSALLVSSVGRVFCSGGVAGAIVYEQRVGPYSGPTQAGEPPWASSSSSEELEQTSRSESSGCFSIATRLDNRDVIVAVGGDYSHPDEKESVAWTTAAKASSDPKQTKHSNFRFAPAKSGPGGYRSAVAFDSKSNTWIAVGPTGSDISTDDGLNWRPLNPPSSGSESNVEWNAISLPFVVGPHGRIGRLNAAALSSATPTDH